MRNQWNKRTYTRKPGKCSHSSGYFSNSMAVHANQADEAYIRVGDKSKKLTFEERTQLMYDKGERYFEDKSVPDASIDDIDMEMVQSYIEKKAIVKRR